MSQGRDRPGPASGALDAVGLDGAPAGTLAFPAPPPGVAPWLAAVGPPVWHPTPLASGVTSGRRAPPGMDAIRFLTWNLRVGAGDLRGLMDELVSAGDPFVLLLQEAFRAGAAVPSTPPPGSRWAGRIADALPSGRSRDDVCTIARDQGLALLYAPSMRSGGPGDPPEDRGNAILSSLPLDEPTLLDLPVERQRRTAVAATVRVPGAGPHPGSCRLVSVHLENRAPWRRFWRIPGASRATQARDLVRRLEGMEGPVESPGSPVVLGGDLNSWWGQQGEPAVQHLRRYLPHPPSLGSVPTHHWELGLDRQSDYLLFRLPEGWTASVERHADERCSDHWPLEGRIVPAGAATAPGPG